MNESTKAAGNGKSQRDILRSALLGNVPKPASELLTLFGVEVELRQPTLRAVLAMADMESAETRSVSVFIEYAYVPGTDERIFEPADTEVILNWPFTEDLTKLQTTVARLTGVDISGAEVKLESDPLADSLPSTP